jgi:hypothetical protein
MSSLVTGLFSLVFLLSPHRSGFKFQTTVLSVLCDVPSIAVFSSLSSWSAAAAAAAVTFI